MVRIRTTIFLSQNGEETKSYPFVRHSPLRIYDSVMRNRSSFYRLRRQFRHCVRYRSRDNKSDRTPARYTED